MAEVTPEDQAMLEEMLYPLLDMVYKDDGAATIEALQVTEDPVQGAGELIGNMLIGQQTAARQNNAMIPPKVIMAMAQQLANNVMDVAVAAGLVPEEQSNEAAEGAMFMAMDKYGQAAQQMGLTPEEMQEYATMLGEIEQARGMTGEQPQQQQQPQQPQPQQQQVV